MDVGRVTHVRLAVTRDCWGEGWGHSESRLFLRFSFLPEWHLFMLARLLWIPGGKYVMLTRVLRIQVEAEQATRRRRQRQLARVAATSQTCLGRLFRTAWLRTGYIFADHTRNALILAVFAFKVRQPAGLLCTCLPTVEWNAWVQGTPL
jgi:hypothetical protein